MESKQSSANPASAGKIVNLSGKHAGTLIKDTPSFPEGASPDVFRKNSRAVKKWLKNVSEYFSLQYAQMIALVLIKTLVNAEPDEIKTKDLWRIWALFNPQLELVQRQVHETVGLDTLGLALLVGAKGDFEQYLQPPFKIYFIKAQFDKLSEGERARAHSAGRTHAPTQEQWSDVVQSINAIADPACRLFTKAISNAFGDRGLCHDLLDGPFKAKPVHLLLYMIEQCREGTDLIQEDRVYEEFIRFR